MSNYSDSQFGEDSKNTSWYKVFHMVPEGSKVLDFGCSSGNFGAALIRLRKCKVDGLEIDPDDAKQARKKLGKVYQVNIEHEDDKQIDRDYDVIYFGDVIEHLVDPIAVLKKVRTYLSPKGVVIFSIPNMGHIGVRLALLKGDFDYTETGLLDKTHLHFYTLKEIKRVFAEAGYNIEDIDFVEKDYPQKLLKDWLKGIGLTPSSDFFKQMQGVEASAFQFVGVARPSVKPVNTHKLAQFGPIDLFESYFTNVTDDYKQRIIELEAEVDTLTHNQARPFRTAAKHHAGRAKRLVKRIIKG